MCRSIKTLFHFEPPATESEIRAASLQFVRKPSGFSAPSHLAELALADLPGLGPKSQAMLAGAGIHSLAQLRHLGSVRAYAIVKATGAQTSLNLLWALEGALTGLPWQVVAREHRLSLLLTLEALESQT